MDPYINLKEVSDFKWANYDVLTNPKPKIPEQTEEQKVIF